MNAIIKSSFWTDPRIEAAPAEVKLACLWLMTNPSRDICGFTFATEKRCEFETKQDATHLQEACDLMPESFKKVGEGIYFAVNFIRHQFGKGGSLNLTNKVLIAAVRHAEGLPKPMSDAFFKAYNELYNLRESIPLPSPSHPPPHGVREEEGEVESKKNIEMAKTMIRQTRPEWDRETFSAGEELELIKHLPEFVSIPAKNWPTIKAYMRASLSQGDPSWQPRYRKKFIEDIALVHDDALRWSVKKHQSRQPKNLIPIRSEPSEEDRAALAEFLKIPPKIIAR